MSTRLRPLFACTTLALALALAACTGDDEVLPEQPDGAVPGVDSALPVPDECECIALGVDYMNGVGTAATFGLPSLGVTTNAVPGAVSGDPAVRWIGDRVYIVNRFGFDNVTVIDPASWTVLDQFSVGSGFNPQDIAVSGDEAWVVGLGDGEVRVFDLTDTAAAPATIQLPTLAADADGNPDAVSIVIDGGRAYVALAHLEAFMPTADGEIAVIDVAGKTVSPTTLDLSAENPGGLLRAGDAALYIGTTPDFSPTTGCLEKVTPGATPSAACLAASTALGGFVTAVAPDDDGSVWVAAAASFTEAKVVNVSATGSASAMALTATGQQPQDLAACGRFLVLSDGSLAGTGGGLRVYDTGTRQELTTQVIDVGLPPAFASGIACAPVP